MYPTSRNAWLAALALSLAVNTAAPAETAAGGWHFSLDLGTQWRDLSGERASKFEEYRDVSNGVLLDNAAFGFNDPASPWSFEMTGDHLGRLDESASLEWSRAGTFDLGLSWNRTPHFLSKGATSLWSRSGGELRIPDVLQNQIESFFTATPAPTTAQARAFMGAILAQGADEIDLRTRRDTARLALNLDLTPSWSLDLSGKRETKTGLSRIGTGTYIRRQTAGSFDRNRFEPRAAELPLPLDFVTEEAGIGTTFRQKSWFVDVGWEQSAFTNEIDSLIWDNPFEGFPGATSSLTGLNPGFEQEPSGATANTNNRGRFPEAQLDLFPDNDFERVHATAALSLPAKTRINAAYSSARMEQDDRFLPYVLNPAVIFSNGADGVGGTADDVLARDAALPRVSLGGELQTTRMDLRISSRPIDPLSLRASYRRYDYENETPSILFPGFAAAGDSYFRPGIGQRNAAGVRVLFNEPGGYTRTAWSAGGAWSFGEPATVDLEYTNARWDYEERQVEGTTEDQIAAKVRLAFGESFEARLSYLDASRDIEGPYAIGFETSRLRAFDVWKRERTRYGLELGTNVGERLTLGLSYQNWEDDYPGVLPAPVPPSSTVPFPSLAYGLNEALNESLAATLSYAAEEWSVTAALGLDASEWTSLAVAKTSLPGDSPQFDPVNRWRRTQEDDILWGNLVFESTVAEKGKLVAELDYHDYEGTYRTVNLGTPNVNDGQAYAVPDFSSSLFSGKLTFEWSFDDHFEAGARYWYEPYRLDDWQWDLVQPYMQGILQETGGSPSTLRDAAAARLLFLDATYSDYTANVFALYLRVHY